MLCYFLLYSKVNQPYMYLYPLCFGFPPHLGHHSAPSRVPSTVQQVLIHSPFCAQQCICVNPSLSVPPTHYFPTGIHTFVLYVCVFISVFQVRSSPYLSYNACFHKSEKEKVPKYSECLGHLWRRQCSSSQRLF